MSLGGSKQIREVIDFSHMCSAVAKIKLEVLLFSKSTRCLFSFTVLYNGGSSICIPVLLAGVFGIIFRILVWLAEEHGKTGLPN